MNTLRFRCKSAFYVPMSRSRTLGIVLLTLPIGIVICHGRDIPLPAQDNHQIVATESRVESYGIKSAALTLSLRLLHQEIGSKRHKRLVRQIS
jgi:hypothetical protein